MRVGTPVRRSGELPHRVPIREALPMPEPRSATRGSFRVLRSVAPALAALPESELDGEVRRIVGRESRLAWKARLEIGHPALLLDATELTAKTRALAAADEEVRK